MHVHVQPGWAITLLYSIICPSEVCVLPLYVAAEWSVHYFGDYFSYFFLSFFRVTYFSPRRGWLMVPLHGLLSYKNKFRHPPFPLHYAIFHQKRWVFWKAVLWFWNFGYNFWGIGGDVWRWLCRHMHRKNSTGVDGRLSGGSSMRRPGSEDPHRGS